MKLTVTSACLKKHLLLLFTVSLLLAGKSANAQIAGTYAVGTGHFYNNLTDVAAALKNNTVTGDVIFELQSSYSSATEVFPLTFKHYNTLGGNWRITIRPAAGTTILTEGDAGINAALIVIDSTDRITFDGRAGGAGSIAWTIRNKCAAISPVSPLIPVAATSAGPAILFINDATYDTLTYLNIEGMNPVQLSAVVVFGTTNGPTGNSFNGVNNCRIHDRSDTTAGTATPAAGILSMSTSATINNNYNTINNNLIYNFFYPSSQMHGVRVNNATGWAIRNNRFFQETPVVFSIAINHKVIRIDGTNTTCTNHIVEGNIIGSGSASGTGMFELNTPTIASVLTIMDLNLSQTGNNIIRNNTISNIKVTTSSVTNTGSPSGVFGGFNLNQGFFIVDSNTIGSKTDTSSILVIGGGAAAGVYGITCLNKKSTVANNYIGGITIDNTPTTAFARISFFGINSTTAGGIHTIINNTVGGKNLPYSIQNRSGTSNVTAGHQTIGIQISSSPTLVDKNVIANLTYSGNSSTAQVIGINSTGTTAVQKVGTGDPGSGNEVSLLYNNAPNTNSGATASVIGLMSTNTTIGQLITQNRIHNLFSTASSAAVTVIGLHYAGSATGSNDIISRNIIHSLSASSSNNTTSIFGLNAGTSSASYQNNMVRIGLDSAGNDITNGYNFTGINITPTGTGTDSYYHNTVYVGGNNVVASSNTYAFNRNTTTNTTILMNNILVNMRSNASGTAVNCVLRNGNIAAAGLTTNYNVYHRNNLAGGKLFGAAVLFYDSIQNWQYYVSNTFDINSGEGDPMLIQPAGSASTFNLRAQASNRIERAGIAIAAVTEDFDGNPRSGRTPHDIGASSGNYTLAGDIFPPKISFLPLGTGIVEPTRIVTGVTITDNVAVATGADLPRMYFKRRSELNTFAGNSAASNGWKFVNSSNSSSPYSFTIDYSLLSTFLIGGDTVDYFFAATDNAGNVVSSPASADYNFVPAIQNISRAPVSYSSFLIANNTISGLKTVCASGCDYTSLTGVTGLFQAMDSLAVTGNVTATIMTDITEDGVYALNYFGTSKLLIQSDGNPRTISNSAALPTAAPLINLNGAANVTINGGPAKNLTFANLNAVVANTGSTFLVAGGSANDTIMNCIIRNNASTSGRANIVLGTSTSASSGIVITQNLISDSTGITGQPAAHILSSSASNNNLTISNNLLYNFRANSISLASFGSNATITGNSIYHAVDSSAVAQTAINLASGTGIILSGNYVGGKAPMLGGGTWYNRSNGPVFAIASSTAGTVVIENNQVGFISGAVNAATMGGINGSFSGSPAVIRNNEIHDLTSIGTNGALFISLGGIILSSSNQYNMITGNKIYNLQAAAASGSPGISGIGTNGTASFIAGGEISGNTIYNFTMPPASAATPDMRGIGPLLGNSNALNLTISNNSISLGHNVPNNVQIEGIWNNGTANANINVYHNSISIGGSAPTAALSTAAILRPAATLGTIRNNIFHNSRTKAAGAGINVAVSTAALNGWNSDYNLLSTADTTASLAVFLGGTYGYSGYKAVSLADANSVSKAVVFTAAPTGDLHLTGASVGDLDLAGAPLSEITRDIDNQPRDLYKPYMGSDEIPSSPLPVKMLSFHGRVSAEDAILDWSTASESQNEGFYIERSANGRKWETLGFVRSEGIRSGASYSFTDKDAFDASAAWSYRLRQLDRDGKENISGIIRLQRTNDAAFKVSAYPNPFTTSVEVDFGTSAASHRFVLTDISGKQAEVPYTVKNDHVIILETSSLKAGIYFLTVETAAGKQSLKLVR